LDEIVTIFAQQVALGLLTGTPTKQRHNPAQTNGKAIAKGYAEAHCLLIGLQ
jgi:hypothetical protein